MKTTKRKLIEKELEFVKERLTENGYREFLAKAVTCTTSYFNNGGTLNWKDFELK